MIWRIKTEIRTVKTDALYSQFKASRWAMFDVERYGQPLGTTLPQISKVNGVDGDDENVQNKV